MFDRYTKAVLTVIAISLSVLAIQNIQSASAVGSSGCGSAKDPCHITLAENEAFEIVQDGRVKGLIRVRVE